MGRSWIVALVAAAAAAAVVAAPAGAAQVDQLCDAPSGANGATTCQLIIRESVSGATESPVVMECLGEDVFVNLDVQAIAHETFRPDGTLVETAHIEAHGSGFGLVTGTPVVFNEGGEAVIDNLPDGGMLIHETVPAEVVTQGGAVNLELTEELQFLVAPDGTVQNEQTNVQAMCGPSDHEHLHG